MSEYEPVKVAVTLDVRRNLGTLSSIDYSAERDLYRYVETEVWRGLLQQVWQPICRYTLTPED